MIDDLTEDEANATADEMMNYLTGSKGFSIVLYGDNAYTDAELEQYGLPKELTKQEILNIAIMRYELSTNSFQKYMAVTIATNVSESTVAAVMENQNELQGIDVLEDSVDKHMLADVEVGAFLSSGVDSSYIAAKYSGKKTFTVGFFDKNNQYSETQYAEECAKFLGLENYSHQITEEEYWGEMPITTTITCRVIPEGSARAIALEAGEVDLVWNVDATDCANIEANPDVTLLSQTSSSIEYLGMNTTKEKFKDVRVRQAINYALDKQTFVDTIIEGRGTVANSYINSMIPGWTDEVEAYPYDPAKAKELLAEAGYPNGFECKIYVNGDVRTRSAQIIQAQLAEVGITVDISTYEWGALLDSLNAGEHEMFLLGWSNSSFDADGSTYQLFYSGNHGATGNRAFLTDDKVDELIINAQKESDDSKRMEFYKELQVYLHEISPWCPLYYKNDNVGVRADLKGFKLHKGAQHYLGNCHYED